MNTHKQRSKSAFEVVVGRTTGWSFTVLLKSISVLSTLYLFHFGRTVGASLLLGSRFTMNEVKVCAKPYY
jgi:hypothetical protein